MSAINSIFFTAFFGKDDNGYLVTEKDIGKPVMYDGVAVGRIVAVKDGTMTGQFYTDPYTLSILDSAYIEVDTKESEDGQEK